MFANPRFRFLTREPLMNRRTALGALAVSPVLVASTPASANCVADSFGTQCRRFGLAHDCYLALIQAGRPDAARAFELADAFFAVAASQCPAAVR